MSKNRKNKYVVMCCSDLRQVKGGMATMVGNLLSYKDWQPMEIIYVPTHVEKNKVCKALYFAAAYIKIAGLLAAGKADVFHLHVSERGSFYRKAMILRLAHFFKRPVIFHHHGADFQLFYDSLNDQKKAYVTKILETADMNILLSGGLIEDFRKIAPKAKVDIIHNAVPVPEKNPYTNQGNLIVTLGRLGERKGTFILLQALAQIDHILPEHVKVALCGDGDVEDVKAMVNRLGLEHRVCHTGWISGDEKRKMLENTLCHVLPSYREVLPMSILETMSMGIPNICTDIAAVPDIVENGVQGYLVHPGDADGLSQALVRMCTQDAQRKNMSQQSFALMKHFYSVEACGKSVKNIYREVMSTYAGRS